VALTQISSTSPPASLGVRVLLIIRPVADGVVRVLQMRGVDYVSRGLPVVVAVVAGLGGFGVFTGWPWGGIWLGLFTSQMVLQRWIRGSVVDDFLGDLSNEHGALAGNLDTLLKLLLQTEDTRISEARCSSLCSDLLRRFKKLSELALHMPRGVKLRATLAVPVAETSGEAAGLRIWCYDEQYANRRWSHLPMGLHGAPEAFISGNIQIVDDVHAITNVLKGETRDYKSILSIPVKAGGPGGETVAVLNLDASPAAFFKFPDVVRQLIPQTQVVVNAIALALVLRRTGEAYEFHR